MGLLGGIRRGLGDGSLMDRIAMAQAIGQGEFGAAATMMAQRRQQAAAIAARQAELAAAQREAEMEQAQFQGAAQALNDRGLSKSEIVALRPEDRSTLVRSYRDPQRFDSTGGSLMLPRGPGQQPEVFQAPSERVIDGILLRDGQPVWQSPYPDVIPGPDGSFFEQPRIPINQIPSAHPRPSVPDLNLTPRQMFGGAGANMSNTMRQGPPQLPGQTPPIVPQTSASGWGVISRPGDPRDGGRRIHQGYDMRNPNNPAWVAPMDYEIRNVRNGPRQGITADVHFSDGTRITAMHFREPPQAGRGMAGSIIGYQGNTGNARTTPSHLHGEARDAQGNRIDPTPYFNFGGLPPRITSPDQLAQLPSGAEYVAPDGTVRRKR